MKKGLLIAGFFILQFSFTGHAQDLVIDLALPAGDSVEVSAEPTGNYKIQLINRIPGRDYTLTFRKEVRPIVALPISGIFNKESDEKQEDTKEELLSSISCESLMTPVYDLYEAENEAEVAALVSLIRGRMEWAKVEVEASKAAQAAQAKGKTKAQKSGKENTEETGCKDYHIVIAEQAIDQTRMQMKSFSVRYNETIYVTVNRSKEEGDSTVKQWTYILKAPSRGKWGVHYGFSFPLDAFSKNESYYLVEDGDEYVITKAKTNRITDFVPSVFFVWTPRQPKLWDCLSASLTGGLGMDLESPTVFGGLMVNYNENIGLSFGAVAHQQQKLLSKYSAGDVLSESLDKEQLHESVYRFNPYISLVFRFDQNPFK